MDLYSTWAAGTEDIIRNFSLLPFGLLLRRRISELGDRPIPSLVWWYIYHRSLKNLFLISDKSLQLKNTGVRRRLASIFGPTVGTFAPPVKRAASWVEYLWIFYDHSWGPHCWYSIGGRLMGQLSSISSGDKKVSTAAKYMGLPAMLDRET